MIREVLDELKIVQSENANKPKTPAPETTTRNKSPKKTGKGKAKEPEPAPAPSLVTTSFGNSHLIASCLMLLTQFQ